MKKLFGMLAIACLVFAGLTGGIVYACTDAQTCSSNYQVNEAFFGAGGNLSSCSTNFCSKQSTGELAVGNTKGNQFQAQAGFNTDRQPFIEFIVNSVNIDLGSLTASSTTTANATFSVRTYLANGYAVINASPPPTNNSYTLNPLTSQSVSASGTEQFGINLVANHNPNNPLASFGADPVQVPSATFAFGAATSDYNIPDEYMYAYGTNNVHATVATSSSSTSDTDYTISYIFNVSHVTPGGTYNFHHVLVATSTY